MQKELLTIIGAGPAGCSAAMQALRLGIRPFVIDRNGTAGGLIENAYMIENYPAIEPMDGKKFVGLLRQQIKVNEVSISKGTVQEIEETGSALKITGDFDTIESKAVILASGTTPRRLTIAGAKELEGKKLFYEISQAPFDAVKSAIIIGGGEAALDYSLSLASRDIDVEVIVRSAQVKANKRLRELVRAKKIKTLFNATPLRISHTDKTVETTFGQNNENVVRRSDIVIAAIGRESIAEGIIKFPVTLSPSMILTSNSRLFIAGDARLGSLGQLGIAVGDGISSAIAAVKTL